MHYTIDIIVMSSTWQRMISNDYYDNNILNIYFNQITRIDHLKNPSLLDDFSADGWWKNELQIGQGQ